MTPITYYLQYVDYKDIRQSIIRSSQNDSKFLSEMFKALGWQGGTIWQVIEEIQKLKLIKNKAWIAKNCIAD